MTWKVCSVISTGMRY